MSINNKPSALSIVFLISILFWASVCIGLAISAPQVLAVLALIAGGVALLVCIAWVMGVLK